jgi:limonene-1,2-epoxide hydrolase
METDHETIHFETVHHALHGDDAIAEQIHGLGLLGKTPMPVVNMAIYQMRNGKIAAWHDSNKVGEVLAA